MVAMRGQVPEKPTVEVTEADLALNVEEHCRNWQADGVEIIHQLAQMQQSGQLSNERYQDALRAMSQMSRLRREFEKAVFGEELDQRE
jgi:hypothetical protein